MTKEDEVKNTENGKTTTNDIGTTKKRKKKISFQVFNPKIFTE